jgi:hypothetical protein
VEEDDMEDSMMNMKELKRNEDGNSADRGSGKGEKPLTKFLDYASSFNKIFFRRLRASHRT